jgi:hypothetical protein
MYHIRITILLILIALLIGGCVTSSAPEMIAAFPSGDGPHSSPLEGVPPPPLHFVYNADLTLQVGNTASSARKAESQAIKHSGYLVNSQAWRVSGDEHITLVLAVPVVNFEDLLESLRRLGTVKSERISGEWVSTGYGSDPWAVYSRITLQLRPKPSAWTSLQIGSWNPGSTFQHALNVFITIFGFIVDILIWILVVVGPFLLFAWGTYALFKRLRRTSQPED